MNTTDPQAYIDGVISGDRRMMSKTITLIESSLATHQKAARRIIDAFLPYTGKAVRLGITGVPGVGKSTFIESLGMSLVRDNHRVAVLAVDPSSVRSGGSVMADKTRMEKLTNEKNAFIRPSPSSGALGGVARKTRETMLICEAAGYDVIIVETVGVGQSESAVASMVDFFLVLMLAGAGDELQGIKKGILELADAIAITKADGDNVEKAKKAAGIYETALHFLRLASPTWVPPVLTCSSADNVGIRKIWQTVVSHNRKLSETGELEEKRRQQALDWMWSLIEEGLKIRFNQNPEVKSHLPKISFAVEKGNTAPTVGAEELLFFLDKNQLV